MKKTILLALICCICLPFCSCSGPIVEMRGRELIKKFSTNFETDAVIRYGNREITVHIEHPAPDRCDVLLFEPEPLAGLTYCFRQDNVDVLFRELRFTFDAYAMPQSAPVKLAVAALNTALRPELEAEIRQDETGLWELDAVFGETSCQLVLDGTTGNPLKLSVPDGDLEIHLSDFTFLS